MSWNTLPPAQRDRAKATLTERQLDVLILHLAGCSQRKIAIMLNISRSSTRDHLERAINVIKEDNTA